MIEYIQKHCIRIIIGIIALAVVIIVIISNTSGSGVKELKNKISDLEKKEVRHMEIIDSVNSVTKKQADSLRVAKRTIFIKHEEWLKLNEQTKQKTKFHESITFKPFTDQQRDSVLSILYPSFRPVR